MLQAGIVSLNLERTHGHMVVINYWFFAKYDNVMNDPGGFVSLTFCELSKIFSRNVCVAEITLLMSISSWNFVRVHKAMLWAHVQSFTLKFSPSMWFLTLYFFARLFWRARETLVKQPPGSPILLCGRVPTGLLDNGRIHDNSNATNDIQRNAFCLGRILPYISHLKYQFCW